MIKKILTASLVLTSLVLSVQAHADNGRAEARKKAMKLLEEMGLPLPSSGINIVPRSQLDLSDDILEAGQRESKQRETLGYVEKNTSYPSELLDMTTMSPVYIKSAANNFNEHGTHMRKNIKDLKLAFKFKGVTNDRLLSTSNNITPLGVAPQGAFNKDMGGWSGAAQFFTAKGIGTCSYGVMNVKASGTAVEIAMEDVAYDINNKATLTMVEGSKNSGFIYRVRWYDDESFHELECANSRYSKQTNQDVIELAKKIDGV